jgi:hypothetical protein
MGEYADDIGEAFSDIGNWIEDEIWEPVLEGSKQIGEYLGYGTESKKTKRAKRQVQAQRESAERRARGPNLDEAQRTQVEADRLRRRRGVLANIYAGPNAASPNVGTKVLLGS